MATGRIGVTPVLGTRWSKAPAGGTTSLSGLDDNSVSLVYSVGYEQVYRNGVLLSRGNDYTATNGTSITLTDATITGDIIEVFAQQLVPLTDTYSQSVANGKFINNTLTTTTGDIIYASAANTPARLGIGSTDQVLKVSGGVPAWGAIPTASWSTYTPTWTNLTVGNGTVAARYTQIDKVVFFNVSIVFGSTTSVSAAIEVSVPVTAASTSALAMGNYTAMVVDDGVGNWFATVQTDVTNWTETGKIRIIPWKATGTYVLYDANFSSTVPFTWATNDRIMIAGYYEVA